MFFGRFGYIQLLLSYKELLAYSGANTALSLASKGCGRLILRAEVVGLQRCFGKLSEAFVADRELVVVFRSGGCSVLKLKLNKSAHIVLDIFLSW